MPNDDINNLDELFNSADDNADNSKSGMELPRIDYDEGANLLDDDEDEQQETKQGNNGDGGRPMSVDDDEEESAIEIDEDEDEEEGGDKLALAQKCHDAITSKSIKTKIKHLRIPKTMDALMECSNAQLRQYIDDITNCLGRVSNKSTMKAMAKGFPTIYEQFVNNFIPGVSIEGFSAYCKEDPEFEELADELAWTYASFEYQSVESRALMYVAKSTSIHIGLNKMKAIESKANSDNGNSAEKAKELNEEYDDL